MCQVSITPSIRDTVSFKKFIEVFDHSAVKFMVGCNLLILLINDLNLLSLFHIKKICSLCTSAINAVYIQILLLYLLVVLP